MAHQSVWYQTFIDEKIINCLCGQINNEKTKFQAGKTGSFESEIVDKKIRDSEVSWLPTTHWISSLIWFYVERANRENFKFDINSIDGECLQLTTYGIDQYYGWHRDDTLASKSTYPQSQSGEVRTDWGNLPRNEATRKLSFSLILSDKSEYEGGQFQMLSYENKLYEVPQEKGLLVIFDSTTLHRVRPVKKGIRKSLVGWVLGPRWR